MKGESNSSQFMIRSLSQHRDLCRNGLEIEIRVFALDSMKRFSGE